MDENSAIDEVLSGLNPQQREAVRHGRGPLLIVAGAGTGKTATLVHRVAWLIANGMDPSRILLLTFTRRAAAEMLHRVQDVLRRLDGIQTDAGRAQPGGTRVWGGTFHAIAARLLRRHGKSIGLPPEFSIHDRTDSEDLLNVIRTQLELAKTDRRFPKKRTCMAIYSRCVSSQRKLERVLEEHYPWCDEWAEELKKLFDTYVDRKEASGVLDYDDLLLYWHALLSDPKAGPAVRKLFDCVLVDEYQDTNTLQAGILYGLSPDGQGLTVVGDDAQSIYSFRAATVRNILDLPKHYPDTTLITLEQNYRSTQQVLKATNEVIALAKERFTKNLWSERTQGERPALVSCQDENDQTDYVIRRILEHREAGIDLRRQAVLFRASHHSMALEAELARRNIPFHKYGGLKFIETAHIKDLIAFLKLAENPRDETSGTRLLLLLPGIGPKTAGRLMEMFISGGCKYSVWKDWKPPPSAAELWPKLVKLLENLTRSKTSLSGQVNRVRKFYGPLLEQLYDNPRPRARDLEQLEQIAAQYNNRQLMLTQITLDPPSSTQDLAGKPLLDDDYLVLSTIHSAKGLEWDAVYVIHAADGNIPSDMATGSSEEIEEERRLFYVALTRAKDWLYVCFPLSYYRYAQSFSDSHTFAQRTRFVTDRIAKSFNRLAAEGESDAAFVEPVDLEADTTSQAVRRRTKDLW